MKTVGFAVPGDLATPTGGYAYDRRIIAELPALGWQVDVLDIGEGFPRPSPQMRAAAGTRLATLPEGMPIVIDGLAYGVLPDVGAALRESHPLVALVHHPLAFETGLTETESVAFRNSERAALNCARHVVATSAATARLLGEEFGVQAERLTVVRPGTDRVARQLRPPNDAISLLCVAAIVRRKGYDVLIAALAKLIDRRWRLVIVGDRTRSPDTAAQLDADIADFGLAERIEIVGAVEPERLTAHYSSADLFVLPTRFEGYGMAYTEAIAHGVPIIGTNVGAVPDTVPAGAGILLPPDDSDALAETLRRLIDSPAELARLTAGARAAAASFPTWREQAALFARMLDALP